MNRVIFYQRAEGIALFILATAVYFYSGLNWLAYLLLLFSFDISMLGYLVNKKFGAEIYNFVHNLILPSIVACIFLLFPHNMLLGLACLWFAHIGLDRALGYGLKLSSGFKDTHLGKIGKEK
ncbi:MAG: DUF4260 domain-containing protein [Candidatus Dojkabacteria bacterium]|nr:MAG: DUF4260 domain-containing protein [Candidatus Dojkabacteria bacterium]